MRLLVTTLALTLALPAPALAQSVEAQLPQALETPLLSLNVSETVTTPADIVRLNIGVLAQSASASDAMAEATRTIAAIRSAIVAAGVEPEDIDTRTISLGRWRERDPDTRDYIDRGFQATSTVQVEAPLTLDIVGMIEDVTLAGANDVNGPYFDFEDRLGLRREARERAVERARAEANEYARLFGFSRARLVEVGVGASTNRSPIRVTGSAVGAPPPPPPPPPPPAPGGGGIGADIGESVSLQLTFALVR